MYQISLEIVTNCSHPSEILALRNFGGKKRYLYVLAIDIRNWCVICNIYLSISHVADFFNVEAEELPRWLNLN